MPQTSPGAMRAASDAAAREAEACLACSISTLQCLINRHCSHACDLDNIAQSLQILDEDSALLFHLQRQHLIELIRQGSTDEALQFAQEFLAYKGEADESLLDELGELLSTASMHDLIVKSAMVPMCCRGQEQCLSTHMHAHVSAMRCSLCKCYSAAAGIL